MASIVTEIGKAPDPSTLDDSKMMIHYMEVMGWVLYILRICVGLEPVSHREEKTYTRDEAVIVGHMVRITKLYDGFCQNAAKRQLEFCGIFMRLLSETEIKLRYLFGHGTEATASNFVLASYKTEKQMLQYFEGLESNRELIPIEARMKRSILREIDEEGISKEELLKNKHWNMDGLDIRAMLKKLDHDHLYPFMYGGASRWVHGGWPEFRRYHLEKKGEGYQPRLDYGDPGPEITGPVTQVCLEIAQEYLGWAGSDPDGLVDQIISMLLKHVRSLEQVHESSFSS